MSRNAQQVARLVQRLLQVTRGRLPIGWVLLLAALLIAYLVAQPRLERALGIQLPGLTNPGAASDIEASAPGPKADADTRDTAPPSAEGSGSVLRSVGGGVFESPAGLRYRRGSRHGHRLKHVMAHTRDDPDRPGQHGVFDTTDRDEAVLLIDEAFLQAESGQATQTKREEGRVVHTVDLGRRIGFIGGQSGNRRGRPAATHLRLVLQAENVITAYPVTP